MISTPPKYNVAKSAPYGNDFSTPHDCHIRSGRLVYYDLPDGRQSQLVDAAAVPSNTIGDENGNETEKVVSLSPDKNGAVVAGQFESLQTRNGNLTETEEQLLIAELLTSLKYLEPQRLEKLLAELNDYDPNYTGITDASTALHITQKHVRSISVESLNSLLKLFARDPRKPRQIYYQRLVEFLKRLELAKGSDAALYGAKLLQNAEVYRRGSSTAQSPQYERGDGKLIAEIHAGLKRSQIESIDGDRLHQLFNIADRLHNGTLGREQIESVIKSIGLFEALQPSWESIMFRCAKGDGSCYHWPTIVRLIEKSQPQVPQSPTTVGNYRRDMDSSFSYSNTPTKFDSPYRGSPVPTDKQISPTEQLVISPKSTSLDASMNELKLNLMPVEVKPKAVGNVQTISKLASLLEAIERVDQCKTGWIPVNRARQVITAGAEFYGLNLGSKAIEAAINSSTDPTQRLVAIAQLAQILKLTV